MAIQVGAFREVALTKESTPRTAETPAAGDFINHSGHSFRPEVPKIEQVGAKGNISGVHRTDIINQRCMGSIPMDLEQSKLWLLGTLLMGTDPVTTGVGPYTHNWDTLQNDNDHQTFTVSYTDKNVGDKASPGALLDKLTLDANIGQYVTAMLDMVGLEEEAGTYTPSYNSANETYFVPADMTFKLATNYAGLGAANAIAIDQLTAEINKNVKSHYAAGALGPVRSINERMTGGGSFHILNENTTYRDLAHADTTRAMSINLTSGNYQLTLEFPTITITNYAEDEDPDTYVGDTLEFKIDDRDTTNGLLKVEVIDDASSH